MSTETPEPPTPKYKFTVEIIGNSHDEIEQELHYLVRGGYLLDSDYGRRDTFKVYGGRKTSTLEHTNPDMTPDRYKAELDAWWTAHHAAKKQTREKRVEVISEGVTPTCEGGC